MNTLTKNQRSSPADLVRLAAPNPTPMHPDEPEAPFPTVAYFSLTTVMIVAAIIKGSIVMLLSALLVTPLLILRLFIAIDDWEERRAAVMKPPATSTINHKASPATTPDPQPTSHQSL